jgi:hypothetical protein
MGKSGAACKSGVRETPLPRVHEAESLACMKVDRDGQLNNVRVQGRLILTGKEWNVTLIPSRIRQKKSCNISTSYLSFRRL